MSTALNIPFLSEPREGLICGGQPDPDALRQAAEQGVKAVINLRPDAEMDWDEAALVNELGLEYQQLPVAGPPDVNADNARQLGDWISAHGAGPVLVHCASSNRVGALLALHARQQGQSADDALAFGRAAGLTKLEPLVRQQLDAM